MLLICFLCCFIVSGIDTKAACTTQALTGYIVLGSTVMYAPYLIDTISANLSINISENDPLCKVFTYHKINNLKMPLCFPGSECVFFPSHLPLSLLENKKENETIECTTYGGCTIRLICKQKEHYKDSLFHEKLLFLINQFKEFPNFIHFDEKKLIEKQIIIKKKTGNYIHGPKGYTFK